MIRRARRATGVFQEFFRTEASGAALLFASAILALVAANTGLAGAYHSILTTTFTVAIREHGLSLTLHDWINDGLMAIFFLLVGLEIKRELLAGELSTPRHAMLPITAAVGGMVVPAVLYFAVNSGGIEARGWAIPTATDIAFALGTLALIAPRAPNGLRVFLAALAIVDDLGAVLVIALFYSGNIVWAAVAKACLVLLLLIGVNALGVRRVAPYLVLGVVLWWFVRESRIHATLAGVMLAFTIPTRTRIDAQEFSREGRALLDEFDKTETGDLRVLTSKGQQDAIVALERASESVTPTLVRLEHALHGFSAFVVMPLFALSNAGVTLAETSVGRVSLGVAAGLAAGKALGITGAAFSAIRLKLATLPEGVNWTLLHGCAWLGGIGFTMSLFISTLAFEGTPLLDTAKIGIVGGSAISGIIGAAIVRRGLRGAVKS